MACLYHADCTDNTTWLLAVDRTDGFFDEHGIWCIRADVATMCQDSDERLTAGLVAISSVLVYEPPPQDQLPGTIPEPEFRHRARYRPPLRPWELSLGAWR